MKLPSVHLERSTAALTIKAAILVMATVTIYHQDLLMIFDDALHNELTSYILCIPILLMYLVYRKRKMLRAVIPTKTANFFIKSVYTHEIVGSLLCLTAFLIYWHGSYTFYPLEYHMLSLFLFTTGLILAIFNAKTLRVLAFPSALLLLLTPPPSEIVYIAGSSIAAFSSEVSYNILRTIGLPVNLTTDYGAPALIVTGLSGSTISFVIGFASSGIYSLLGFGIFATFLTYITNGQAWKRATLFFASLPLMYLLNITRIITLISLGYWQGESAALNVFHLLEGWVFILIGTFILLIIAEKILKIHVFATEPKTMPCLCRNPSIRNDESFCPICGKILRHVNIAFSKREISKIALLFLITILIIDIQAPVFALTEGPAQVLIESTSGEELTVAQIFPQRVQAGALDYNLSFAYRDKEFEEKAPRDAALLYEYTPLNGSGQTIYAALELDSSKKVWHTWESSVIIWPGIRERPVAIQLDLRDIQLLQNPPIFARFFVFKRTNSSMVQVVLYWQEIAIFQNKTAATSVEKYVKTSLITFTNSSENIYEIEEKLLPFGLAIADYWQPIKTWSQIAMVFAQQGGTLTIVPATFLAIIFIIKNIRRQKEKKSNMILYSRLAPQEGKLLLKAVFQASQKGKSTGNAIASQYNKITGRMDKPELLLNNLYGIEEAGLVKREIINQGDEPLLVWKSQVRHLSFVQTVSRFLASIRGNTEIRD